MSSTNDTPPKPASVRDVSPASIASEGGEKPVREQLQKTKIDATKPAAPTSAPTASATGLRKKRSFESVEKDTEEAEPPAKGHARKRSRDGTGRASTPEKIETDASRTEVEKEGMLSPKGKRSREDANGDEVEDKKQDENGDVERDAKRTKDEEAKVEEKKESTLKPLPAAFSNFSSASPFATSNNTSPQKSETNNSAFASSGFAKLANSTASPFAATGTSTASPFGIFGSSLKSTTSTSISTTTNNTAPSPFANFSKASPFATNTSSASPFGNTLGSGTIFGSKPFGGSNHPPIKGFSNKPARPFGAPASDEESAASDHDDEDNEDEPSKFDTEPEKKDKRFYEQDISTGEENEQTVFSARAKVFEFSGTSWHERGVGLLKLNLTKPVRRSTSPPVPHLVSGLSRPSPGAEERRKELGLDEGEGSETDEDDRVPHNQREKLKARYLLRADGSQRVVLNSPVTREFVVGGNAKGEEPDGNTLIFRGWLAGKEESVNLTLKMKAANALQLWEETQKIKPLL